MITRNHRGSHRIGVKFIQESGGAGVRLRKVKQPGGAPL